jgi:nucleotide-binding universal stress UspA family protein
MYRTILVAVDGSDSGFNALRQALSLAKTQHGAIKVISVAPPHSGELSLVGVREHVNDMIVAPHQKALDEALKISGTYGVPVKKLLRIGEPSETIVDAAEELNCKLIVVGVRGGNPARTILMGSTAARVIGFSNTDVLAVPLGCELSLERAIVALDGSASSKTVMSRAFALNRTYGLALSFLSVADIPSHLYGLDAKVAGEMINEARQVLEPVHKVAEKENITSDFLVREGKPGEIIVLTAKQKNSGIIIIGSHGRTGIKRLLMGSVAERVIGNAPCPVLVVRS